jgi:hypothetical protein
MTTLKRSIPLLIVGTMILSAMHSTTILAAERQGGEVGNRGILKEPDSSELGFFRVPAKGVAVTFAGYLNLDHLAILKLSNGMQEYKFFLPETKQDDMFQVAKNIVEKAKSQGADISIDLRAGHAVNTVDDLIKQMKVDAPADTTRKELTQCKAQLSAIEELMNRTNPSVSTVKEVRKIVNEIIAPDKNPRSNPAAGPAK